METKVRKLESIKEDRPKVYQEIMAMQIGEVLEMCEYLKIHCEQQHARKALFAYITA